MIEAVSLNTGYNGQNVLHGVSLSVNEGDILSIIGPNGCGKTTLLKAICGLLPAGDGYVLADGKLLSAYGRREFAKLAAILPQVRDIPAICVEPFVSHGRYPHLGFGRRLSPEDREIVASAMEQTGVYNLRDKELSRLSGGERQRVYLAMALAQDAKYLFLDEPTTYLDIGQKFQMLELIKAINAQGKTIIMVLHDLPLAFSYSHSVALMDKGKILLTGTPEEVFHSGVPDKVFGVCTQRLDIPGGAEYIFRRK